VAASAADIIKSRQKTPASYSTLAVSDISLEEDSPFQHLNGGGDLERLLSEQRPQLLRLSANMPPTLPQPQDASEEYGTDNVIAPSLREQQPPIVKRSHDLILKYLEDGVETRLRCYDFGGQKIYYSLISAFLQSDAIHLLVFNLIEAQEAIMSSDGEGRDRWWWTLKFWLRSVHSYKAARIRPDVIMVGTHKDELQAQSSDLLKDLKTIHTFLMNELDGLECFKRVVFPPGAASAIRGNSQTIEQGLCFFPISCDTRSMRDSELSALEDAISYTTGQLLSMKPRPLSWVRKLDKIREEEGMAVSPLSTTKQPAMTLKEALIALTGSESPPTNQVEDVRAMLRYFHQLGEIVYFDDLRSEPLMDTVIALDPLWVAEMFRKVLTRNDLVGEIGQEQQDCERFPPHHAISSKDWKRDFQRFLAQGVISKTVLEHHCWQGKLPTEINHAIQLLNKMDLICPLTCDTSSGPASAYLIPCIPLQSWELVKPKVNRALESCGHVTTHRLCELDFCGFLSDALITRFLLRGCRDGTWRQPTFHQMIVDLPFAPPVQSQVLFCLRLSIDQLNDSIAVEALTGSKLKVSIVSKQLATCVKQLCDVVAKAGRESYTPSTSDDIAIFDIKPFRTSSYDSEALSSRCTTSEDIPLSSIDGIISSAMSSRVVLATSGEDFELVYELKVTSACASHVEIVQSRIDSSTAIRKRVAPDLYETFTSEQKAGRDLEYRCPPNKTHLFARLLWDGEQHLDGVFYYVTIWENCPKGDLRHFIENQPHQLTPTLIIKWANSLIDAVYTFHHHLELLHLDIKPDNIFITATGELKLGDYGISMSGPRCPSALIKLSWNPDQDFVAPEQVRRRRGK